jgi:hypothetical protein
MNVLCFGHVFFRVMLRQPQWMALATNDLGLSPLVIL